jgi:hypothetical protein
MDVNGGVGLQGLQQIHTGMVMHADTKSCSSLLSFPRFLAGCAPVRRAFLRRAAT